MLGGQDQPEINAGEYVTGDVDASYLAELEESIRVAKRDRAGASADRSAISGMVVAATPRGK